MPARSKEMTINLVLNFDPALMKLLTAGSAHNPQLDRIEALLTAIAKEDKIMAQELDDLKAEITRNTEVEKSALVLIQGIGAKVDAAVAAALAAGATPEMLADIKAVGASLKTNDDELAAAVAANTKAA